MGRRGGALRFPTIPRGACSSAWLEQGAFNPRVAGSNPARPTPDVSARCRRGRVRSCDAHGAGRLARRRGATEQARAQTWIARANVAPAVARALAGAVPVGPHVRHALHDRRGAARRILPRARCRSDVTRASAAASSRRAPRARGRARQSPAAGSPPQTPGSEPGRATGILARPFSRKRRPDPRPHRLVAQDAALSRRKHGFEPRWGHGAHGPARPKRPPSRTLNRICACGGVRSPHRPVKAKIAGSKPVRRAGPARVRSTGPGVDWLGSAPSIAGPECDRKRPLWHPLLFKPNDLTAVDGDPVPVVDAAVVVEVQPGLHRREPRGQVHG